MTLFGKTTPEAQYSLQEQELDEVEESLRVLRTTNELLRATNQELQAENRQLRNEVSGLVQLVKSLVRQERLEAVAQATGLRGDTISSLINPS